MERIEIPEIGWTIEVPTGSTDAQIDQYVDEAISEYNATQDTTGIGSGVGGTGGAIAGAFTGAKLGSLAGPVGAGIGAIGGGIIGGALGGAGGETVEQTITGKGSERDVKEAALTEGVFGAIPGGAGVGIKGGFRALRGSTGVLGSWRHGLSALVPTWKDFVRRIDDIPNEQRRQILLKWVKEQDLPHAKNIKEIHPEKIKEFINSIDDLILKDKKMIERVKGKEALKEARKKLYNKWYSDQIANNVIKRAPYVAGGRAFIESQIPSTERPDFGRALNTGGYFNKGLDAKISKIYKEGYTAPGQAYAIAKSMGYNEGGPKRSKFQSAFEGYYERVKERRKNPPISVRNVAELVPIVGDALAAEEIYRELQNNPPNWTLIGILGGATIIGLIPGVGDAAASAIKAGARSVVNISTKITKRMAKLLGQDGVQQMSTRIAEAGKRATQEIADGANPEDVIEAHIRELTTEAESRGITVHRRGDREYQAFSLQTKEAPTTGENELLGAMVNIPPGSSGHDYLTALEEFTHILDAETRSSPGISNLLAEANAKANVINASQIPVEALKEARADVADTFAGYIAKEYDDIYGQVLDGTLSQDEALRMLHDSIPDANHPIWQLTDEFGLQRPNPNALRSGDTDLINAEFRDMIEQGHEALGRHTATAGGERPSLVLTGEHEINTHYLKSKHAEFFGQRPKITPEEERRLIELSETAQRPDSPSRVSLTPETAQGPEPGVVGRDPHPSSLPEGQFITQGVPPGMAEVITQDVGAKLTPERVAKIDRINENLRVRNDEGFTVQGDDDIADVHFDRTTAQQNIFPDNTKPLPPVTSKAGVFDRPDHTRGLPTTAPTTGRVLGRQSVWDDSGPTMRGKGPIKNRTPAQLVDEAGFDTDVTKVIKARLRKVPENVRHDAAQEMIADTLEALAKYNPNSNVKKTTFISNYLKGSQRKTYDLTRPVTKGKGKEESKGITTIGKGDVYEGEDSIDDIFDRIDTNNIPSQFDVLAEKEALKKLGSDDQKLAALLLEKSTIRMGPKKTEGFGGQQRISRVSYQDIADELGISYDEVLKRRNALLNKLK